MRKTKSYQQELAALVEAIDFNTDLQNFQKAQQFTHPERLSIHQKHRWYRHYHSLLQIFPRLAAHLGPQNFCLLAYSYCQEQACHDPNLDDFGLALPQFLASSEWQLKQPYFAEFAQLELMAYQIQSQPPVHQRPSLSLQKIAEYIQQARLAKLELIVNPSLQLLSSKGNLWQLWNEPYNSWRPLATRQWLAIWQSEKKAEVAVLPEQLGPLLSHLCNGELSFDELGQQLCQIWGMDGFQSWVLSALTQGLLHAFTR